MTLLIGGSGLISTAITRQLADCGDDLILYNRRRTPLRVDGAVTVVQGDRTGCVSFRNAIRQLRAPA